MSLKFAYITQNVSQSCPIRKLQLGRVPQKGQRSPQQSTRWKLTTALCPSPTAWHSPPSPTY
eukprot:5597665-Ditylum_brightwellii.AAC.1